MLSSSEGGDVGMLLQRLLLEVDLLAGSLASREGCRSYKNVLSGLRLVRVLKKGS